MTPENIETIDEDIQLNDQDFYDKINRALEDAISKMNKSVDRISEMRMEAALLELELTTMVNARTWKDIEELTQLVSSESVQTVQTEFEEKPQ